MILANGCSFTEGYDLPDAKLAWPFVVGQTINQPVTNLALGGASNRRISRTLRETLTQKQPDYVVVGWTMYDRDELSHEQGAYVRANIGGCLAECEVQFESLPTLHQHWLKYNQNAWINYRNWIYDVLFFQQYFQKLKIPFRFFTAFGNNYIKEFLNETDASLLLADQAYQWRDRSHYEPERTIHTQWQELVKLCQQIDLSHWVLKNTQTMQEYLNDLKFNTDHTGHFLADGHAAWAQVIARELS